MAKNSQPIAKRCRALGISPAVMGYSKKSSNRNPGGKMRRKQSEYGIQLTEKQFRMYYEKAEKMEGKTGENLLSLVERRLDNVVYRLGLCSTRREGRQLVNHAHFTVNGKKCNIPSYIVKAGDVIAVADGSKDTNRFKAIAENDGATLVPKWLEKTDKLSGKVIALPARDDIDYPVEEHLIVELYSK